MINLRCVLPGCTNTIVAGSATHHVLYIAIRRPNYTEAQLDYCSAAHLQQGGHQILDELSVPETPAPTSTAPATAAG